VQTSEIAKLLFQANISSIMSSESQVKNIMECIDEGLKELDELEEKLERYDRLLQVRNKLRIR
jgi:hypothetical protein